MTSAYNNPIDKLVKLHANGQGSIKPYPKRMVIALYGLLGGAVGGLVFVLGLGLLLGIEMLMYQSFDMSWQSVKGGLLGGVVFTLIGSIVGMPSALLTGIIIASNQLTTTTRADYGIIFVIGFGSGLITGVLLQILAALFMGNGDFDVFGSVFNMALFAVIGGLSAVILAKFVLPKAKTIKD